MRSCLLTGKCNCIRADALITKAKARRDRVHAQVLFKTVGRKRHACNKAGLRTAEPDMASGTDEGSRGAISLRYVMATGQKRAFSLCQKVAAVKTEVQLRIAHFTGISANSARQQIAPLQQLRR